MDTAKDFFESKYTPSFIQYVDRPDTLGGQFYISLRRQSGKIVLAIGGDEGEIDIRFVNSLDEYEQILGVLHG